MKKKFCITFAGAVGSSKTPIAHYLSWNLNLPIHSNDAIRSEVFADLHQFNQDEYIKRRNDRNDKIFKSGMAVIYDASIDREWNNFSERLRNEHYEFFIISLDLTKQLLEEIYHAKGISIEQLDKFIQDHQLFLENHSNKVEIHISDKDFPNRLALSLQAAERWINE